MERLQLIRGFRRQENTNIRSLADEAQLSNRDKLSMLEILLAQPRLSDLLQTYAVLVSRHFPVCRLSYHMMTRHLYLLDMPERGHKYSFNLHDSQMQYLGRLDYEMETNLSREQQRKLRQFHHLLMQPLRLYLQLDQLDMLSRRDHLTGIGNRAYFDEILPRAIEQNQRMPDGLTLVLLDLDRFKHINDTHGHPVGDMVLREYAGILTRSIRRTDLAFRLGGDEFALILQPAELNATHRIQGRIERSLGDNQSLLPLSVACSLGHARWQQGMTAQDLYQYADELLYQNKRLRA